MGIKHLTSCSSGTAKVWLGFATLHILAKNYQPLNRALYVPRVLMNPAIPVLKTHLAKLEAREHFESIDDKAAHIGEIIQFKDSIAQLELCEKYGITGGSLISQLPETPSIEHQFVVAYQN